MKTTFQGPVMLSKFLHTDKRLLACTRFFKTAIGRSERLDLLNTQQHKTDTCLNLRNCQLTKGKPVMSTRRERHGKALPGTDLHTRVFVRIHYI